MRGTAELVLCWTGSKLLKDAHAILSDCCESQAISLPHSIKSAIAMISTRRVPGSAYQMTSPHLLPPWAAVKAAKAIKRKKQSRLPASYADDFVGYDEEEHVPGHSNKRLRVSAVSEGR